MSNQQRKIFQYKIILIGEKAVGKTSIRRNYMGLQFISDYSSTIGTEFASKTFVLENTPYSFHYQIWDIAGQKLYSSLHNLFYTGAHAVLVVFDLTNERTFYEVMSWVEDAFESTSNTIRFIALIGNKKDIEPDPPIILEEEIIDLVNTLSQRYRVPLCWIKTSAKTGENINKLFKLIGLGLLEEDDQKTAISLNPELEEDIKLIHYWKPHIKKETALQQKIINADEKTEEISEALITKENETVETSNKEKDETMQVPVNEKETQTKIAVVDLKEFQAQLNSVHLLLDSLNHQINYITEKINGIEKRIDNLNETVQNEHEIMRALEESIHELQVENELRKQKKEEEQKNKPKISLDHEEIDDLLSKLDE